jgi:hypothetical protein
VSRALQGTRLLRLQDDGFEDQGNEVVLIGWRAHWSGSLVHSAQDDDTSCKSVCHPAIVLGAPQLVVVDVDVALAGDQHRDYRFGGLEGGADMVFGPGFHNDRDVSREGFGPCSIISQR